MSVYCAATTVSWFAVAAVACGEVVAHVTLPLELVQEYQEPPEAGGARRGGHVRPRASGRSAAWRGFAHRISEEHGMRSLGEIASARPTAPGTSSRRRPARASSAIRARRRGGLSGAGAAGRGDR